MKAISSFNVQFITRTDKNPKENSLIYVRISMDGKRTEISLKKTIETSSWNSLKECVKSASAIYSATLIIEIGACASCN